MANNSCVHVDSMGDYTKEDILRKHEVSQCSSCPVVGPNLWLCLHDGCRYVGCDEQVNDHSTQHFKDIKSHCLTFNLTSLRLWCYICECEVFLPSSSAAQMASQRTRSTSNSAGDQDSDDENLDDDHSMKPRGLTGLQNIGNTCYMNSAIQALSNCPPLTQFFLDCGSFVRSDQKPGLAKSYLKLMYEMWHKNRPGYVVPSSIAYGIKMVFPMFRGYTQQDSQEFLRCFMDQLHEELKEPVETPERSNSLPGGGAPTHERDLSPTMPSTMDAAPDDSSQSDAEEYETCDSGLSSEKSSCSSEDVSSSADPPPGTTAGGQKNHNGVGGHERVYADRKRGHSSHHHHRGGVGGSRGDASSATARLLNGTSSQHHHSHNRHGHSQIIRENGGYLPLGDTEVCNHMEYSDAVSDDRSPLVDSATVLTSYPPSPPATPHYQSHSSQQQQQQLHRHPHPLGGMSASAPQINGSGGGVSARDDLLPGAARFQSQMAIAQGQSAAGTAATATSAHQRSYGGRRKRQVKFRSVISDVFDGKLLSSVQCLTCDRVSATKETFQDLSLPIPNREYLNVLHASQTNVVQKGTLSTCTDVYTNQGWITWMFSWMKSWFTGPTVSLQDCLAAFFSADELKGDNMYSCEKCKKLRNGIKYSKVLDLPEILCIHLKRFRHEVMFSSKISNYVSFPLEGLDLQPFLHKDCPSAVTTYDLVAVICHHGTAGGGHYTAYGLNCINDQWYEFDDQYVTEVDPRIVASCEAYVLFYRKVSEDMMKKRQRAMELMEISMNEPSLMHFYISKQWVNKFNTFSEPGPIDNSDFLCPHAGVHPSKIGHVEDLYTVYSQGVWEYLHDSFGGGPPCTHLYLCSICQLEMDNLEARRKHELDEFIKLHREFMAQDSNSDIYAISMSWFRMWENFVRAKENDSPGPIDNSAIATTKNGAVVVKVGSDYAQVSEEMWQLLFRIYGGGPQLTLSLGTGTHGASSSVAGGDSGGLNNAETAAALFGNSNAVTREVPTGHTNNTSDFSAATSSTTTTTTNASNPSTVPPRSHVLTSGLRDQSTTKTSSSAPQICKIHTATGTSVPSSADCSEPRRAISRENVAVTTLSAQTPVVAVATTDSSLTTEDVPAASGDVEDGGHSQQQQQPRLPEFAFRRQKWKVKPDDVDKESHGNDDDNDIDVKMDVET